MISVQKILILTFIIYSNYCYSQAVEPASTVGNNILQIEIEGIFAKEKDGTSETASWMVPNTLFRFGISDKTELQFNAPFQGERLHEQNEHVYTLHRFDDFQIGASLNLWNEHKYIPQAALMVRAILPSTNLSFKNIGEIVALNFSNNFGSKLSLNYNLGYIHEVSQSHAGYYIINLYYAPNQTWHFYIENTGEFVENETIYQLANAGFGMNITNNFTADFSFGKGINQNTYYTGLIMSLVIDTNKKR